jgi:peptidoglycan hydrolase CwlO-like protein
MYEEGAVDMGEIATRVTNLTERIEDTQKQIDDIEAGIDNLSVVKDAAKQLSRAIDSIPDYIRNEPPAKVNARLRGIFDKFTIHKNKTVTLHWKA